MCPPILTARTHCRSSLHPPACGHFAPAVPLRQTYETIPVIFLPLLFQLSEKYCGTQKIKASSTQLEFIGIQAGKTRLQLELARSSKVTSANKDSGVLCYLSPTCPSPVQGSCTPHFSPKTKVVTVDLTLRVHLPRRNLLKSANMPHGFLRGPR